MPFKYLKRTITPAAIGAMMAFSMLISATLTPAAYAGQNEEPQTRQLFAMTTVMNLKAYGKDAGAALDEAEEKIRSLDSLLSTGTKGSEVWQINHDGGGTLSDDTATLTDLSLQLYQETNGAFDFTIYPIMKLWGFTEFFGESGDETESSTENAPGHEASAQTEAETQTEAAADALSSSEHLISHVPTKAEIEALLPLVDSSKVIYNPETKKLTLPSGVQIDFGGIAKGYTSQAVMDIYQKHHLTGGLADLGGNIQVTGNKPDGSPWRVGIEDPADTSALLGILTLSEDSTVITSGGYERYLVDQDGKRYPHIIDPSTGYPVKNDLSSASIICKDGALADGLSTSLCVMGKMKAISFWKAHKDQFDMVLFDTDQTITISEGLKDSFTSDRYEIETVSAD
ncbi:FAD:protein FMN transferase [Porcincola intestinalis]|uniref:FAD:protein FMN transferase n=1 Tax=Porcincola intestinalis TaxID=2606632 RepID=UPI002A7ED192|nr:FAD:protein FMN transferase [Porcincola intestinalis]MCI6699302.1 FAD:protein FMN transferase [Lachnospiraceae bacterium]MDY4203703.1 FAD:protein FMN transferase [Porcincola intestinalis]